MRVYVINAGRVVVSREQAGDVSEGDIVVASLEELRAVRLTGKQLLAVWNGLPGAERLTKVGDRENLLEHLWAALEALPDPEPVEKVGSKQAAVITMLRRPEGATVGEIMAATGWQPHTVRGMFSGALKKKLGLIVTSTREERGRVYRLPEQPGA
jgi:hypothetical protein